MGFEIERKWLIKELPEEALSFPHKEFVQGYLCAEPTVRVRKEGDDYVLTYKGTGLLKREEYNLPLTKEAFAHLIAKCDGRLIHKTRYFIPLDKTFSKPDKDVSFGTAVSSDRVNGEQKQDSSDTVIKDSFEKQDLEQSGHGNGAEGLTIELDIYHDEFEGLVTAEIEFSSEEAAEAFKAPLWFAEDVSLRPEYKNSYLALSDTLSYDAK